MRILIAEDEEDIRNILKTMLVDAGHQVALAGNYDGAQQLLDSDDYDLMLADMVMPGGNGLHLAQQARARGMAAVLCTGHPDEALGLETAGIAFLQKPFSMRSLLSTIAAVG